MTPQQPSHARTISMSVFAATAVRTAWLNASLSAELDGTPTLAFGLIVLGPLSVLALFFLAKDIKHVARERKLGWRRLTVLMSETIGVGATLAALVQ